MRCLGFKIKILGGEHLKRCYTTPGCPIIVMNHVSYMVLRENLGSRQPIVSGRFSRCRF